MSGAAPERYVVVVDRDLPLGLLANAVAIVSVSLGQRHPTLVGDPSLDRAGAEIPGLVRAGIPILAASGKDLGRIRLKGLERGCDVVALPAEGQRTDSYEEFQSLVALESTNEMRYVALAVAGERKVVGSLSLLRSGV